MDYSKILLDIVAQEHYGQTWDELKDNKEKRLKVTNISVAMLQSLDNLYSTVNQIKG
jgi:hypothetical protein